MTAPHSIQGDHLPSQIWQPSSLPRRFPSRSIGENDRNDDDVSWILQYSRVFKIEYEEAQVFNVTTYQPSLSQQQKETISGLDYPAIDIGRSKREPWSMLDRISFNIWLITEFRHHTPCHETHIGMLKLICNCVVNAASEEATTLIQKFIASLTRILSSKALDILQNSGQAH
ncbi:hypothetical protein CC86DRAFT_126040 [Ophiobolus disseminans]|uniref:Uncharacterized protein n=1 Tax=Ophiobolus disseminans TaxID=1469910 RepID=A0A6A6ZGI9_9PLEO|nr:hypothetical protein CC86DRAFT_126040 [Ophiobolus disseminans]